MTERMKITPTYKECSGILIPPSFSVDACLSAINFQPKPNQLFIVTYPKCGTTWMQHIVMLILRKGKPLRNSTDFFTNTPFLEMTGADAVDHMTSPGVLKLHLPLNVTPFYPHAKYIYVARNPKDCCVSLYHHTKGFPVYSFQDATFDDFFDIFIKGEVEFGDYFDHLIPWYERRNDSNVLFITYENLKKDTKTEILKVAKFIGEEYERAILEDRKVLEHILYYSSFEYMKEHVNKYFGELFGWIKAEKESSLPSGFRAMKRDLQEIKENTSSKDNQFSNTSFVRKGVVGDWKNYFTPEQEERLRGRINEKTSGSDVMNLWKNI